MFPLLLASLSVISRLTIFFPSFVFLLIHSGGCCTIDSCNCKVPECLGCYRKGVFICCECELIQYKMMCWDQHKVLPEHLSFLFFCVSQLLLLLSSHPISGVSRVLIVLFFPLLSSHTGEGGHSVHSVQGQLDHRPAIHLVRPRCLLFFELLRPWVCSVRMAGARCTRDAIAVAPLPPIHCHITFVLFFCSHLALSPTVTQLQECLADVLQRLPLRLPLRRGGALRVFPPSVLHLLRERRVQRCLLCHHQRRASQGQTAADAAAATAVQPTGTQRRHRAAHVIN